MKANILTLAFLLLLFVFAPAFGEDLLFYLGEKKQLPLPEDLVAHFGDQKILSVQKEGDYITLRGRAEGGTWLTLGGKSYRIFVLDKMDLEKTLLVSQLLKKMWGLKWTLAPDLEIRGHLNSFSDWIALSKLSEKENISYSFKARLGEGIEEEATRFFNSLFKESDLSEISLKSLPWVAAPKGSDLHFYKSKLKPFGLEPREDPNWFSVKPFIKIEVAHLEVSESSELGLGTAPRLLDEEMFLFSSLLKFIEFLKVKGEGQVIEHSTLFAQKGENLKIHSGGQIPFSQYNFQTHQESTHWKQYGLTLNITPELDRKKNILLKIKVEFSEPEALLPDGRTPPLKNQKMETAFQLKNGQVIKIFQREKKGHRTGYKGGFLSYIPFVHSLSRNQHNFKSVQVILIRPEIFTQKQKDGRALKKKETKINE